MPNPTEGIDQQNFFKYKGFIIGIATGGDNAENIKNNFLFFDKHDCDIVFIATRKRSDSSSEKELNEWATAKSIEIEWHRKITVKKQ